MTQKIPVLIVGAGPSGLMMAATLYQHNIECQIIDKHSAPITTSNAAVIHSRTLEMLDDLNLVDPFTKMGQMIHAITLNQRNKKFATIKTNQIESHYNYILSIPQNITEKILNEHLMEIGTPVERNLTLTALHQHDDRIIADLTHQDGQVQEIHCDYLIACDGIKSTVRNLLNLQFTGYRLPQQFIVSDTSIHEAYPDNLFSIYLDDDGPLAVFPFKKRHARIIASINDPERNPQQPVSSLEIQHLVAKRSANQLQIGEIYWVSSFWIQSKKLKNFREGRIFFAGDCAHVHSPVGAQGMNTGMQDAYNLAWKLALKIKGFASKKLLNSYNEEREKNAELLLTHTGWLTSIILLKNPLLQWLRFLAMKFLMNKKIFQHAFIMEISMLNINYKKSSIIDYEHSLSSHTPLPGHRIPDCHFHTQYDMKRLDDLLRIQKHTLLIFTAKNVTLSEVAYIEALEEWKKPLSHLITCVIISYPDLANQFSFQPVIDAQEELHRSLSIKKSCFFIVRPDKYIGCCSSNLNLQLIKNYFNRIFSLRQI